MGSAAHGLPRSVRVLVAAGSPFVRAYVQKVLEQAGRVEARSAAVPDEALEVLRAWGAHVVVLDVDSDARAGLEALVRIMQERPTPVVLLTASAAAAGAAALQGLAQGAVDLVVRPSRPVAQAREFARELLAKVHSAATVSREALARLKREPPGADARGGGSDAGTRLPGPPHREARRVVAFGASSGGPQTLEAVIRALPAGLPAALLVTQHMPRGFTGSLARRLSEAGAIPFYEAYEGAPLWEGVGYVAAGGRHLVVGEDGRIHLDDGPPVHHVRPAVDVMLESVARRFGPEALAVLLTGMGVDGTQGARAVRAAGGTCFAQDEASAVAPSMPRSVIRAGLADRVGPPEVLAAAVAQWVQERQARAEGREG